MRFSALFVIPMPHSALIAMATLLYGCHPMTENASRAPTVRVADAALSSGAPELALNIANIVLTKQPRDVDALVARGEALYAMGYVKDSQESYRAAVAADPTSVAAQIGLGRALVRTDPHEAETAFLAALEREPDNVIALNNLGVARDMEGRHADAQEAYRRALALSPDSNDVQANLDMSIALSAQGTQSTQVVRDEGAEPRMAPLLAPRTSPVAGSLPVGPAAAHSNRLQPPPRPSETLPKALNLPEGIARDAS